MNLHQYYVYCPSIFGDLVFDMFLSVEHCIRFKITFIILLSLIYQHQTLVHDAVIIFRFDFLPLFSSFSLIICLCFICLETAPWIPGR